MNNANLLTKTISENSPKELDAEIKAFSKTKPNRVQFTQTHVTPHTSGILYTAIVYYKPIAKDWE